MLKTDNKKEKKADEGDLLGGLDWSDSSGGVRSGLILDVLKVVPMGFIDWL